MICLVKDNKSGKLIPSCSTIVHEGIDITVSDEEITEARRTGLELLLSDHVGDCDAPCTIACPAHMDIPQMNRLLASGNYDKALKIVKQNIALPAVLGYICPAPVKVHAAKPIDGAVSICMLKRFFGEKGNFKEQISESTGF
jgi:NADPH-dependent glutamate synthase beta subunit-like oxidoreductase